MKNIILISKEQLSLLFFKKIYICPEGNENQTQLNQSELTNQLFVDMQMIDKRILSVTGLEPAIPRSEVWCLIH